MAKKSREEELKPIGLTGKRAGQKIDANEQWLTHDLCKKWKLYCPECYQFVHLRKSNKIKNYFAHYDVEDKNCEKYRVESSSNNSKENIITNGSQEQELKEIKKDFESIISKYIGDQFKKDYHQPKIDDTMLDSCVRYYQIIVNNEKSLKEIIRTSYSERVYNETSYKIVKGVCKILSIHMNRDILNKLIRYAGYINKSLDNKNCIEFSVNLIIKIIASIDWTKNKPKLKNHEDKEDDELKSFFESMKLQKLGKNDKYMIVKGGLVISKTGIEIIESNYDAKLEKLCDLLDEKVQVRVSPATMRTIKQMRIFKQKKNSVRRRERN
jgi:hypothetical protein